MVKKIERKLTHTPAATDIRGVLQLFLAAGLRTRATTPLKIAENDED
jgi:hypothetical protein